MILASSDAGKMGMLRTNKRGRKQSSVEGQTSENYAKWQGKVQGEVHGIVVFQ